MTSRGSPSPQRRRAAAVWLLLLSPALALTLAGRAVGGETGWLAGFPSMVAGIVMDSSVIAAGVPLASGAWGTDYITVSHALGVGRRYGVIRDGLPLAETQPIAACSSEYHRIDALILRAPTHRSSPVVEWGDPADLRAGAELFNVVRREFHREPVRTRFLHINLLQWAKILPGLWAPQWQNVMVGEGMGKPGFSGSPWVRSGRVYGLHKGVVRPPSLSTWYPVAETASRVEECLELLNYKHLLPTH